MQKQSNPSLRTGIFVLVLFFFIVSGATGLVYQVVWTRKLVLLFGTTSYAVSTVLAIFFGGLGLGSLIGGRVADRVARPLFVYGVIEIVIGLWAAAFILLIDAGEGMVVSLLPATESNHGMGILLRAILAAGFLAVPVTLMGATLPLLARYATVNMAGRGLRVSLLYSINTAGAVTGAVLAGFYLLPEYGYTLATFYAAAANGLIGIGAIVVGRSVLQSPVEDGTTNQPTKRFPAPLILAAFGVSGFCAIALEVVWTRMLVLLFSGTTYAYSTMLAAVLVGIALGSAVLAPVADRVKHPGYWFGVVLLFNGAACIVMLGLFDVLPGWFVEWSSSVRSDWAGTLRMQFSIAFMALLPPTLLFGAGFPLAVRAATSDADRLGTNVGALYSANTFAGVAGAICGGYFLLPMAGIQLSIVALGGMLSAVGFLMMIAAPSRTGTRVVIAVVLAIVTVGGAYALAPKDVARSLNAWYIPEDHEIIHMREGVEGTVAVVQPEGVDDGSNRTIYINRVQATATIEQGVRMNRFQGVLPMMFNRSPEDVLFMCFGSGTTVGMLAQWDFVDIDAVELSEDVLDVAPYFAHDNLDVIESSRVNFIIDDGRNYLLRTKNTYDLITFEPMPLALSGVSTFYTHEYYEKCLEKLNPGGLVSQWVPLHSLSMDIVRSLTATFTDVFPYYCAWFINADVFLIGSNEPLKIDYGQLETRLQDPAIASALGSANLADPIELVNMFAMDQEAVDGFTGDAPIMYDDRPWAEFVAPKLVYSSDVGDSLKQLYPHFGGFEGMLSLDSVPESRKAQVAAAIETRQASRAKSFEGLIALRAGGGLGTVAEELFLAALAIDSGNAQANHYLRSMIERKMPTYLRWGDEYIGEGKALMEQAHALVPQEPLYALYLARFLEEERDPDAAKAMYQTYVELGGTDAEAIEKATR